ncbi:hypothetical protein D3C86_867170 [compost metagenome]
MVNKAKDMGLYGVWCFFVLLGQDVYRYSDKLVYAYLRLDQSVVLYCNSLHTCGMVKANRFIYFVDCDDRHDHYGSQTHVCGNFQAGEYSCLSVAIIGSSFGQPDMGSFEK